VIVVYGIRQCDTCRKALKWLESRGDAHRFHDLRTDGLQPTRLSAWLASPLAAQLVNRRSTTWRRLSDGQKRVAGAALQQLLLDHPTLVKRPVFERDGRVLAVGFDATARRALGGKA